MNYLVYYASTKIFRSIYKIHTLAFGKRQPKKRSSLIAFILSIFLCFFSVHTQSQNTQHQLKQYFACIESPDSDQESINRAIQSILKMGNQAVPLVKQRFQETRHPSYFYLLQKLEMPKTVPPDTAWSKEGYFLSKYNEAEKALKQGNTDYALQICQAILVLEHSLSFHKDIEALIQQCKDSSFSQKIVGGKISSDHLYCSPGKAIPIRITLENYQDVPVTLVTLDKHGIILEIKCISYNPGGTKNEQNSSQIIPLHENLLIGAQKTIVISLEIPNPETPVQAYRTFFISAYIPRCRIEKETSVWYPRIEFGQLQISCLPETFHYLIHEPWNNCMYAMKLGKPITLFYASFFLRRDEETKLVPELIANLGNDDASTIIIGILKRITRNDFIRKNEWQTWWQARGVFWQESHIQQK